MKEIRTITVNDMDLVYIINEDKQVSFTLVPESRAGEKEVIPGGELFFEKGGANPLVQISCTGDAAPSGFAAGMSHHNSALTMAMRFGDQKIEETADEKRVVTYLSDEASGLKVIHTVTGRKGSRALKVGTTVYNGSHEDIMAEALSSVCLSGITPYTNDNAQGRLHLHRFRSRWSAEGRHCDDTIEDLMLEPSWAGFGMRCEKFGAVGSMPVRGFFPFVSLEDRGAGVFWGITLACSSSWQIEVIRNDENLSIAGGFADYEYGHFRKMIPAGESFKTPEAYISVSHKNLHDVCDRLLDAQRERLTDTQKRRELPLFFNEYCTTWGNPGEENIDRILSVIKDRGYEYFVIDAGWYADSVRGWQDNMGDWRVAEDLFPNGIKPVVEKIEKAGMKAGIWFELEVVGKDSDAVRDEANLLTRDGKIIISGTRRFWDMRKDSVERYLTGKVIDFLNENGFKYIKIDYNENIGIGCDGAESCGEGLRQVVEAAKGFYKKIRESVPGIAIEVCSSGGHRLEPGFMELADYLSFSDAHEEKEIPVIALDLQDLILPSKSQIWSVLRKSDSLNRIVYSICAGMYGTLCISGDVFDLSQEQWEITQKGTDFYRKVSPVIADGETERFGPFQNSNRALKEYQASVRYTKEGKALVIVHAFEHDGILNLDIPLREGHETEEVYEIEDIYETGDHGIMVTGSKLHISFEKSFDAAAVLLKPFRPNRRQGSFS
ncbi:MAG: alpha-galactosidase [Lachnospiraceae bacterium]|nr:alpha-galactosidase [Lachnospiraceae bacterium]